MRSCLVLAVCALGAAGCSSTPSDKRVALDLVEAMTDLSPEQQQCMREKIEGYSNDELERIGLDDEDADGDGETAEVVAVDFDDPDSLAEAPEDLRAFVDDLRSCTAAGG